MAEAVLLSGNTLPSVCTHTDMRTLVHAWTCHTQACTHISTCTVIQCTTMHTQAYDRSCTHRHARPEMCTHRHVHTHAQTHAHSYKHTYTRTRTHRHAHSCTCIYTAASPHPEPPVRALRGLAPSAHMCDPPALLGCSALSGHSVPAGQARPERQSLSQPKASPTSTQPDTHNQGQHTRQLSPAPTCRGAPPPPSSSGPSRSQSWRGSKHRAGVGSPHEPRSPQGSLRSAHLCVAVTPHSSPSTAREMPQAR